MDEESLQVQCRHTAVFEIPEGRKIQLTCALAIADNTENRTIEAVSIHESECTSEGPYLGLVDFPRSP